MLWAACRPPERMLTIGTGIVADPRSALATRVRFETTASARTAAHETASIAFAPRRDLSGVPSSSIIRASTACVSFGVQCLGAAGKIGLFDVADRLAVRLGRRNAADRRRASSSASCLPVDAPDGACPIADTPFDRCHARGDRWIPARVENLVARSVVQCSAACLFPKPLRPSLAEHRSTRGRTRRIRSFSSGSRMYSAGDLPSIRASSNPARCSSVACSNHGACGISGLKTFPENAVRACGAPAMP